METKECCRCKNVLPLKSFQLRSSFAGEARRSECTQCKREYDRLRNAVHRAKPKPKVIWPIADQEVACNGAVKEWGRPADAPRLQLFGLVGVMAMEDAA